MGRGIVVYVGIAACTEGAICDVVMCVAACGVFVGVFEFAGDVVVPLWDAFFECGV